MPNLLITDFCNRSCSYCFAREKVAHKSSAVEHNGYITPENLEKVIHYLKKSSLNMFSVLGGEPTLHPRFNEVFDRILEEGFQVRMFTNGIIPGDHLDYLESVIVEKKKPVEIILNINHPRMTPEDEWLRIEASCLRLKDSITLSYNIFDVDLDFDFLIDVIETYGLNKNIRFGLAQPIVGTENAFLEVSSYPEAGTKIVAFSEKCDPYDIKIGLDCGFVLCMFDARQIGELIYRQTNFSILCGSIIDIGPDLTVWKCFPLSKMHNMKLTQYENEQQLKTFFDDKFKPYRRFGMMEKCFHCRYLIRGQCTGGCIAHKIKRFKGMPNDALERNGYR